MRFIKLSITSFRDLGSFEKIQILRSFLKLHTISKGKIKQKAQASLETLFFINFPFRSSLRDENLELINVSKIEAFKYFGVNLAFCLNCNFKTK